MKTASWVMVLLLALMASGAREASAMPVAGFGKGGFADFAKAIVFDTSGYPCPTNAETIATNSGGQSCALPMKAVGDGSWTCSAAVFAGVQYKYYFEYRIPIFDSTTAYTDSQRTYVWRNAPATGTRNQDNNRTRTITVPATASNGYVFYNKFGDQDVKGMQGTPVTGDSWLTTANPALTTYQGTTTVSTTGDGDTMNMGGANAHTMSVLQTADTTVKLTWSFNISAADDIAPSVEGAREFDTQSTYAPYGFRILRAKLPAGWNTDTTNPKNLVFEDTVVNQVTGDTLYSPSRSALGISWYSSAMSFVDTSLPASTAIGDSYIYTAIWVDAYGDKNDTSDQNFSGGAARWVRSGRIEVLFLVEQFDPKVVFPNGASEGRVRVTPYVDGIPQPAYGFWTKVHLAKRESSQG